MNKRIRIIGGQWRRRWLTVLDLPGLRPTSDRVRETLFNWLGQDLTGQSCLDMFAGTGALGFEAASRGASQVLMIERHPKAMQQLQQHRDMLMKNTDAPLKIEIINGDALCYAASLPKHSFDIIFLDPPFNAALLLPALQIAHHLLRAAGSVYAESPDELTTSPNWSIVRHGKTRQTYYYLLQPIHNN